MTLVDAPPPNRRAGRLFIIDARNRILLFSCFDPTRPETPSWWFTPGGGVEPGESIEDAARRECLEETGLVVEKLGVPVHRRLASFVFEEVNYEQEDVFYLVRVVAHRVDDRAWTDDERRFMTGYRWWSSAELAATRENVYPVGLSGLLDEIGAFAPAETSR